jgi:hypothetical protein
VYLRLGKMDMGEEIVVWNGKNMKKSSQHPQRESRWKLHHG